MARTGIEPVGEMMTRADYLQWPQQQRALGFSQAVSVQGLLYISGTVSLNDDFTVAHAGDMRLQVERVYELLGRTLAYYGLDPASVIKETMYTTRVDDLVAANDVRKRFYGDGPYPASTGVEVSRLLFPELLIEIELIAAQPST